MSFRNRWVIVGAFLSLAAAAWPGSVGAGQSREREKDAIAYREAYNLVLQEKWEEAIKAMDNLIKEFPKSSWGDDAVFWKCYAREKLGQTPESVFQCYQEFITAHPQSEWADDARANMVRLGSALAKAGKVEYEAKVRTLEEDQEVDVRLAALYALKDLGDSESLKTIIDLYDTTKNPHLRSRIVFMLQDFKSPEAFAKLKDIALNDPDPQSRRMALLSMAQSEDPEAVKLLKEVAKSGKDVEQRKAAVMSLMEAKDPTVSSLLIDIALNETNPEVARMAVLGLQNAEGSEARQALLQIL